MSAEARSLVHMLEFGLNKVIYDVGGRIEFLLDTTGPLDGYPDFGISRRSEFQCKNNFVRAMKMLI